MLKSLLPVALCLGLIVPALAADATLNAADIRARIIGHTLSGREDGRTYRETLFANGRIKGVDDEGNYTGRWSIRKDRLCFIYDDDEDEDEWECSAVRLDGDAVTFVDPDGSEVRATLN